MPEDIDVQDLPAAAAAFREAWGRYEAEPSSVLWKQVRAAYGTLRGMLSEAQRDEIWRRAKAGEPRVAHWRAFGIERDRLYRMTDKCRERQAAYHQRHKNDEKRRAQLRAANAAYKKRKREKNANKV